MKHAKNIIWHIVTPPKVLSISKVEKETPFNYIVFILLFYGIPLDLFYKKELFLPFSANSKPSLPEKVI